MKTTEKVYYEGKLKKECEKCNRKYPKGDCWCDVFVTFEMALAYLKGYNCNFRNR